MNSYGTQITRKDRFIMQWGGTGRRLRLLLSSFDGPETAKPLPDAEYLRQIRRVAVLLNAARPDRRYRHSYSFGMEDHYGYLFRLFSFQHAMLEGQVREAAYTLSDVIESAGYAVFQPRVLYAILGTLTPAAIERLREVSKNETAMEDRQGQGSGTGTKTD